LLHLSDVLYGKQINVSFGKGHKDTVNASKLTVQFYCTPDQLTDLVSKLESLHAVVMDDNGNVSIRSWLERHQQEQ